MNPGDTARISNPARGAVVASILDVITPVGLEVHFLRPPEALQSEDRTGPRLTRALSVLYSLGAGVSETKSRIVR